MPNDGKSKVEGQSDVRDTVAFSAAMSISSACSPPLGSPRDALPRRALATHPVSRLRTPLVTLSPGLSTSIWHPPEGPCGLTCCPAKRVMLRCKQP